MAAVGCAADDLGDVPCLGGAVADVGIVWLSLVWSVKLALC